MFVNKQKFPLLFYNAQWQKEIKKIKLQWRNQSYCCICLLRFAGVSPNLKNGSRKIRQWILRIKQENLVGSDKTLQNIIMTFKNKSVLWPLSEEIVIQSNSAKKSMPITYLIPPIKTKPRKKNQKSAHPYTTQKVSPLIWFLVNTLSQTCSTVLFSGVQQREEGKSQQAEEQTTLILLSLRKIPRQFKLWGWAGWQSCLSIGRHERKHCSHSVTTFWVTSPEQLLAPIILSTQNQGIKSPNFYLLPTLSSARFENLFWCRL